MSRTMSLSPQTVFLSTPSARRATPPRRPLPFLLPISIHALREEGDPGKGHKALGIVRFLSTPSARRATWMFAGLWPSTSNFYPRPPRGGRRREAVGIDGRCQFLSTPSARRATALRCWHSFEFHISIHALREEGDILQCLVTWSSHRYFYPRPPRGGRQQKQRQNLYFQTNYTTFCTNLEEP